MKQLTERHHISKVIRVVVGGNDIQSSLEKGLQAISDSSGADNDIGVIHDGFIVPDPNVHDTFFERGMV